MESSEEGNNSNCNSINKTDEINNYETCLICGDLATGRHYKVISCDGCRLFFRRSIRKKLNYRCRYERNCEIKEQNRTRCRYCRLQKCFASGMTRNGVQVEREPIGNDFGSHEHTLNDVSVDTYVMNDSIPDVHPATVNISELVQNYAN